MRVIELLSDPQFSDLELLAGAGGQDRMISSVSVVDTPDGTKWLTGGELLITTGFMLGNDEQKLTELITDLSQRGTAALGIKRNRYISSIPDSALRCADLNNLPLISIPESYAFTDLITPILSNIINQQHAELTQADIIHSRFMELAVNDRPVGDILQTLSLIIGIPCAFVDLYFQHIYHSDDISTFAKQLEYADPFLIATEHLDQYDHYTVANKNHVFGHILFPKGSLRKSIGKRFQVALDQAGVTLILRMQVRISSRHVEEQYRRALIEDILLNNIKDEQEIHNRATLYDWDFKNGGFVIFVDINHFKSKFFHDVDSEKNRILEQMSSDIFDITIREIKQSFPSVKSMRQRDFAALLITLPPERQDDFDQTLRSVYERVQHKLLSITPLTVSWGVGSYYQNIQDVHRSYAEARTTISLGETLQWFGRILFFKDMKLYHMLKPLLEAPDTNQYCEQYIQPLVEYDKNYNLNLVDTLNELIQTGWNLKKTAENMYLHYNSMKYRYSRICHVMDLDLSQHVNRLMVSIAIIVYMMNRK